MISGKSRSLFCCETVVVDRIPPRSGQRGAIAVAKSSVTCPSPVPHSDSKRAVSFTAIYALFGRLSFRNHLKYWSLNPPAVSQPVAGRLYSTFQFFIVLFFYAGRASSISHPLFRIFFFLFMGDNFLGLHSLSKATFCVWSYIGVSKSMGSISSKASEDGRTRRRFRNLGFFTSYCFGSCSITSDEQVALKLLFFLNFLSFNKV